MKGTNRPDKVTKISSKNKSTTGGFKPQPKETLSTLKPDQFDEAIKDWMEKHYPTEEVLKVHFIVGETIAVSVKCKPKTP